MIEENTLPGGDRARVCFIGFDKSLYYFNLRSTLKQPQMLVVPDTNDIYIPARLDDLMVGITESYELIINLLDNFNNYFVNQQTAKTQESCFVASIQAANAIIKSVGGKVLMFQASPTTSRHPMLQVKASSPQDVIAKFGSSNEYFLNTGNELAHV